MDNKYNIKNSIELTKQLKNVHLSPNSKFISLDIKDMFTNIPVEETINIIQQQLTVLDKDKNLIEQLVKVLRISLKQNYFSYNQEIYIQRDGLPMGSPLSPIISEIFLQQLELQHIEQIKQQFNIIFYGRYVDDIFIIYDDTLDNSDKITEHFNNLHPKLKFTLEKENKNSLNFLDLTIKRIKYHNNIIFNFNIYRKPTTSELSINFNSFHPNNHKWANFHYLLNRLNNIPLSKNNYNREFRVILYIAKCNNFPINKVISLNNKIKVKLNNKKFTTLYNKPAQKKNWATLTYCGPISDKINKVFNNSNINIGFKNNNYIQNKLKNMDHTTEKMNSSGIYELKCKCKTKYIRKTSRKFKQRYQEHKYSFIYNYPEK